MGGNARMREKVWADGKIEWKGNQAGACIIANSENGPLEAP
jgi:hypothetical protein